MQSSKKILIILLMIFALAIFISGLVYTIYSIIADTSFYVFGNAIPGFVFGIMTAFLGFRYLKAVQKLKQELNRSNEQFSWLNFRIKKQKI